MQIYDIRAKMIPLAVLHTDREIYYIMRYRFIRVEIKKGLIRKIKRK